MKLKILYRKNLKMSPGKLGAQCAHAAVAISKDNKPNPIIVLGVSDKKFEEFKLSAQIIIRDAGKTEVKPKTETCLAYFEHD